MPDTTPSVDQALNMLSDALGRATDDFQAVRATLDRARADMAAHNTSISRTVVDAAALAIKHLKQADEALRDVLKGLAERD